MTLDAPTATLAAALIAALASVLTLVFRIFVDRHAEARSAFRQSLGPTIEELGSALHMIVACCVLSVRDRDRRNERYWEERIRESRRALRQLRPRLRYPLWGLDDGIKAMICLPDWISSQSQADTGALIRAATKLRQALDDSIRRCYRDGRPPSILERFIVGLKVQQLRRLSNDLDAAVESEELAIAAVRGIRRETGYKKIYATISMIEGDEFTAIADDGTTYAVRVANRSGKGSRSGAQPGRRVKLYKRADENFLRYRFLGG